MSLIFLIGIIGNLAFAFKSSFQIVKCYKNKSARDVSMGMIAFDFIGNVCCASFIFGTTGFYQWPQFVNYGFATLFLIILIIMKLYYDNKFNADIITSAFYDPMAADDLIDDGIHHTLTEEKND